MQMNNEVQAAQAARDSGQAAGSCKLSLTCARVCLRTERTVFLEPKVCASRAVVLARSTASKGYDEQSLTGEDGRPDATSDVMTSQQVRCTQSNHKSRAQEAENNFSRQPSRPGASGRHPTQCTYTMAGRQAKPQPSWPMRGHWQLHLGNKVSP